MPTCCMLEPPYILKLTNIYLQVNYFFVFKQEYFTTYAPKIEIVLFLKTKHNLQQLSQTNT